MSALSDRDLGYRGIMAALARVRSAETTVGIQEEEGAQVGEGEALNLAGIAAANELGSDDHRVPERSFLRATMDANRAPYTDRLTRVVDDAAMGRQDLRTGLAIVGEVVEGDIKAFITDLKTPPNAPYTIYRKGSSNPLIDTGRMRASIKHREKVR